ncbi:MULTISPECIES: efflux RND transporter periplasmic adaptor subunit [Thalassospira]|uniref:Efflux RND transporter periplasmic adaptor subunit n=1 Tax=Thalassospira povalilytica TaxID=732237 RepID=A0A8I1MAK8_9PROT|nr:MULTISPECIES: efflux RND transporter periplasmic adaptor subunit [Thalassospira]KZB59092.1 efflux transporter periplasmic adaptor subunit [Thalassospira sp. MCCC 1A02491]MBN8198478.1 efflux RND transporter periplasmic adaptor subunit [Thalassospira povalilytica]PKR49389.1 efflux RND transporter periplasmic adaptor subunit [Thalassospira povalilytica]RCK26206.1 RND transporter [Thalassospira profundimaris]
MARKSTLLIAGVALVAVAASAYIFAKDEITALVSPGAPSQQAQQRGGDAGGERSLPVIAEYATLMDEKTVVESVGTGKSALGVSIYPAVSGEVSDVLVRAGDKVTKGQVLVILNSERERLARNLAAVQVKDAEQLLARYEQARPLGAVAASEVDSARTALAEARIQLDQAEVDLADRTILAPFDGIVGIPQIEAGDRVDSSTVLVTLDNIESILVDFEVAETRFDNVKPGQSVRVETWSLPGELFTGVVDSIGSRIDPESRTFAVRARVPNPNGRLLAGMSFAVYVDIEGKRYPSVPEISVLWGDGGTYVWRIDDDKVARIPVRVVKRTNGRILLDGPIADGDLIVVEGVLRLRPGRTVSASIRNDVRNDTRNGVATREGDGEGS